MTEINEALFAKLKEHPDILYELTPELFERLIARILASFGYEVHRAPPGGSDLIVISHYQPLIKFIVECKHYAKNNKVGVEPVRLLYGLTEQQKATRGIIVTTSNFTRPARQFLEMHKHCLKGVDLAGLQIWIDRYIRAQNPDADRALPLYFDMSEFTAEEITLILNQLSSLYTSCDGDRLIIDDVTILESTEIFEPVGG